MKEFLLGFYIGFWIVGVTAFLFALIAAIYFLAKHNIFVTFVREGTAKAILKYGQFHRIVLAYKDYGLDQKGMVRKLDENGKQGSEEGKDEQDNFIDHYLIEIQPQPRFRIGGLRWVGIPFIHSVYSHEFRWSSFEQAEEGGKLIQKVIPHKEVIDYILVQDDVYYTFIREAETKGMVPVDLDLLLTIRIVNPYKALFRVQNWLEAVQNIAKPALRSFVNSKTYEELMAKREVVEREADEFLKVSGVDRYVERDYGSRLKKIGMAKIDPGGERGKVYVEAASKQWEAEKEQQKIMTLADAEIGRMDKVYGKITSYGDNGLFIRTVEAIEQAGKGPSNLVIFPFGAFSEIIKGWIGKEKEVKK